SCDAAACACSSNVTGSALRTSNPNFSTSAAPVASASPEATCTSASPRVTVPNSPRLPCSPVSRFRTMLDMIASLPLMTAHRGKWAARPVGGTKQTAACPPEPSGSLPCRAGGGEQTDHGSAGHSGTTGDGTHQPGDRYHPPGRDGPT